ncbi:MAG: hypothetical protein AB1714_31490 [Acidobacteriota bacterium]
MRITHRIGWGLLGLALGVFSISALSHAAPVTVSNVRAEWKTKSIDPGKGMLYMKLYLTATVNGSVDRSESLYVRVEGAAGGQFVSDDHSGGLLHQLAMGQSKSYDFPIFISNPLGARPETLNVIFSWGTVRSKSVPFAYFCLNSAGATVGPCGAPAAQAAPQQMSPPPASTMSSTAPVSVSGLRIEWKTTSSGANRGGTYFRLYFDAHVSSPVSQGEKIYATCECNDGGIIRSDDFSANSSKLYEVPAGRSTALDYLFFYSNPLSGRPSNCNIIFRFGKLEKNAVPFAAFCYAGYDIRSGSCW